MSDRTPLRLVDTDVLLTAIDASRPLHAECRQLLELSPDLCTTTQCCREFLAIATRPLARNGLGLEPDAACDCLAAILDRVRLLAELPSLTLQLQLVRSVGPSAAVRDAGIVASAFLNGVSTVVGLHVGAYEPFSRLVECARP